MPLYSRLSTIWVALLTMLFWPGTSWAASRLHQFQMESETHMHSVTSIFDLVQGTLGDWGARVEGVDQSFSQKVDAAFGALNNGFKAIVFFPIPLPTSDAQSIPLAVLILVIGACFFTVRMGMPQIRAFRHAIHVVRGKYDSPQDEGEVTSFQALSAALSATVGLGNIGGVAIAIAMGGPGAIFWMVICGFLGMASKFVECTLGQLYREVRSDGRVMGGGMYYLSKGLEELGHKQLGKFLAAFFAVACIGASFGGGNTFQVNQSLGAVGETIPFFRENPAVYGFMMAFLVAIVILGGIKRIASTAERIVPFMCAIYVLAALTILILRIDEIPAAVGQIVGEAFTPKAGMGGMLGVLIIGFRRAAFSNEAGTGSSAIAHSAAKTPYAAREGVVALLEPFVDTVLVCSMTGIMIVVTGAHDNPAYQEFAASDGAKLTSHAMAEVLPFFPHVLSVIVMLFAYSTMISWSYYGERCWAYLFGDRSTTVYRVIFIVFVFLGAIVSAGNVVNFGDNLIFAMIFPNIVGLMMLSGKVRKHFDDYMSKLEAGTFKVYK